MPRTSIGLKSTPHVTVPCTLWVAAEGMVPLCAKCSQDGKLMTAAIVAQQRRHQELRLVLRGCNVTRESVALMCRRPTTPMILNDNVYLHVWRGNAPLLGWSFCCCSQRQWIGGTTD